jgi:DNA-binding transcriptional LysR family regulator
MSQRLRNLDLATLRSFVTIAETGSMTRAASRLYMTQSAISMQIKRLESSLDLTLFERTSGGMLVTSAGEQLVNYAKQMLDLNDEVVGRLTAAEFEGELRLGVPDDIIFPRLPEVLKQFARDYPRVKVKLMVELSKKLKAMYAKGELDLIMTTEFDADKGGEVIAEEKLAWVGAKGGSAWRQRPLPLTITRNCAFKDIAFRELKKAGIGWEEVAGLDNVAVVEALNSADFGVSVEMQSTIITGREIVEHKGQLPELPAHKIVIYAPANNQDQLSAAMAECLRAGYS